MRFEPRIEIGDAIADRAADADERRPTVHGSASAAIAEKCPRKPEVASRSRFIDGGRRRYHRCARLFTVGLW